jgi:hypothetical protein
MKRRLTIGAILLGIVLALTMPAGPALAFKPNFDWTYPSGIHIGDVAAVTGAGYMFGVIVVTDGTNTCQLAIYDNTSAAGTKLAPDIHLPATPRTVYVSFNSPVAFSIGIYGDITSAGTCNFTFYYRKQQ